MTTLDDLEKLAKAATPGNRRWQSFGGPPILVSDAPMVPIILGASRKGMQGAVLTVRNRALDIMYPLDPDHPDAAYIAALSPQLVLKLLAVARGAEGMQCIYDVDGPDSPTTPAQYDIARIAFRDALAALKEGMG